MAKSKQSGKSEIEIIFQPTGDLIPYARNSRTHSDEQVAQIAGSIQEFGFTNPVLVDGQNGIIAGHGRILAAHKLGMDSVPTICLDYLTEAQKKAYVIADNKLAMNAGWNEELLKQEIESLRDDGFDLSLTGFDEIEIDEMFEVAELLEEVEEILHEQSLQVEPAKEYILILAKDNDEWDEMVDYFDLKKVRRGGYKKGSPFDSIGTERVLKFERIKNADCNTK